MSLQVKGVKTNKSRSLPLSAATVAAHPVALTNEFTSGAKYAANTSAKRLPSFRGKRAAGVGRRSNAALRLKERTIVP